jgi:hypothetical protein
MVSISFLYTRCLAFLQPAFPSKIRCEALRSLRECPPLTLPDDDKYSALGLLNELLFGGLPAVDGSTRDAPRDTDTFCGNASVRQEQDTIDNGTFQLAAAFYRSLAISLRTDSSGVIMAKRRIQSLPTA